MRDTETGPELVVIPCSGRKLQHAAPARELYSASAYFRLALAYAESRGARVLILSALHGLIDPAEVIAPYDVRMGQDGAVDSFPVLLRVQASQLGVEELQDVELLGGRDYVAAGRTVWPHARSTFDALEPGRRGIGYQLQYLKAAA